MTTRQLLLRYFGSVIGATGAGATGGVLAGYVTYGIFHQPEATGFDNLGAAFAGFVAAVVIGYVIYVVLISKLLKRLEFDSAIKYVRLRASIAPVVFVLLNVLIIETTKAPLDAVALGWC